MEHFLPLKKSSLFAIRNIFLQEGGKKSLDELTAKNKFLEKQRNELVQVRSWHFYKMVARPMLRTYDN